MTKLSDKIVLDNTRKTEEGTISPIRYLKVDDVKQFIKEVLDEINEGIKLTIKLYSHKSGEELGAEIYNHLYKIIKQKSGEKLI